MNWNKKEQDNRGFSFVLVIVAMSVAALLITSILYIALQNYQMKQSNLQSQDNFYTAEHVLDEIKAGLQDDISASISEAYNYVMERYTGTEGQEEARNWYFQTRYVDSLRAALVGDAAKGNYNLDKLKAYVGKTADTGAVVLEMTVEENNLYSNYGTGVTLRGLKISYTNDKGYESVISTDLRIAVPNIDFNQASAIPDFFSYAIVAQNGVTMDTVAGNAAIEGNVYAGSFEIAHTGNVTVNSEERTVIQEHLKLADSAKFEFLGGALWAGGIDADSAALSLKGNIFVKDDLTLNGRGSSVVVDGSYYGFSNPEMIKLSNVYREGYISEAVLNKEMSSSVIVNGRESVLDFSGVENLLLAGNTYIYAGQDEEDQGALSVKMGESISVRSNQLAYLAPASAIEIVNGGDAEFGNPITNLESGAEITLNIDIGLKELGGATLASLGIGKEDCRVYYMQGERTAYVYMDFKTDRQASEYFQKYYGVNAARLKEYSQIYLKDIKLSQDSMAVFHTNGNIVTNKGLVKTTIITQEDISGVQTEGDSYQDMFFALTKKLVTSYTALKSEEKSSTIFDNLIDRAFMAEFLSKNGAEYRFHASNGSYEVVVSNQSFTVTSSNADKLRLLIVNGDVTISENVNYEGMILCSGTLKLRNGAKVTASRELAALEFQPVDYEDQSGNHLEVTPMSFLKNGVQYSSGGVVSDSTMNIRGNKVNIAELLIYENWKRQ